ncbi:DUF234 domain-containing protein [Planotetraspora sp. A-T 1434]|nr:DUF234 domain-containing protein [Planotetraspora sp. A-T 1434]
MSSLGANPRSRTARASDVAHTRNHARSPYPKPGAGPPKVPPRSTIPNYVPDPTPPPTRRLFTDPDVGALSRDLPEIDRGLGETVLPVLMASLDDHMGDPWENAFRDHLRHRAREIGPEVVAIGPWWLGDGQHQIDAVALSGRSRTPVLVGEAKWAEKVNAGRLKADLASKAAHLTRTPGDLRYAVAARQTIVNADAETLCVTAAAVFP